MSNISLKQVLPTSVPTPAANYVRLFSNLSDSGNLYFKNSAGTSTALGAGAAANPVVTSVSYNQLYSLYSGAQFVTGSYYLINNFETIYRQPDFYVDGSIKPSLTLKSKPSGWGYQPILVQAISVNALSVDAYQPNISGGAYSGFHKDTIKYSISDNTTEFNDSTKGRIISRVDEYGNETDYDHRTIEFKRYMGYTKNTSLTGTITSYNCVTGAISGSSTLFSSELSVGDIILLDSKSVLGYDIGLKVKIIGSDVSMNVEVDSLYSSGVPSTVTLSNSTIISPVDYNFTGQSFNLWKALSTGDYSEYKEVYFGQSDSNDYDEFYTFPNNSYNNKIGNFYQLYKQATSGYLSLPNLVFITDCNDNKFLSTTFNNTFDVAQYNTSTAVVSGNSINDFRYNTICSPFYNNRLGLVGYSRFSQSFFDNLQPSTSYFRGNNVNSIVNGIDFTGSTHVSAVYNCEIFANSGGVNKLSYYNSSNILTIDNVNA